MAEEPLEPTLLHWIHCYQNNYYMIPPNQKLFDIAFFEGFASIIFDNFVYLSQDENVTHNLSWFFCQTNGSSHSIDVANDPQVSTL